MEYELLTITKLRKYKQISLYFSLSLFLSIFIIFCVRCCLFARVIFQNTIKKTTTTNSQKKNKYKNPFGMDKEFTNIFVIYGLM